ncbi:MAG: 30S ribosomal protein S6 [Acidobacteriota bacterium]
MRKYETFFIVDPDLPDDVNAAVDEKIKNVVTSNGGQIISYTPWGKKKLAYLVKKRSRGLYVLMEYAGGSNLVAELERNMRLDERVIKFITVKLTDNYDPEKEAAEAAAKAAAAEQAAAQASSSSYDEDEDGGRRARKSDEELEEGDEEGMEEDEE